MASVRKSALSSTARSAFHESSEPWIQRADPMVKLRSLFPWRGGEAKRIPRARLPAADADRDKRIREVDRRREGCEVRRPIGRRRLRSVHACRARCGPKHESCRWARPGSTFRKARRASPARAWLPLRPASPCASTGRSLNRIPQPYPTRPRTPDRRRESLGPNPWRIAGQEAARAPKRPKTASPALAVLGDKAHDIDLALQLDRPGEALGRRLERQADNAEPGELGETSILVHLASRLERRKPRHRLAAVRDDRGLTLAHTVDVGREPILRFRNRGALHLAIIAILLRSRTVIQGHRCLAAASPDIDERLRRLPRREARVSVTLHGFQRYLCPRPYASI